MPLTWVHGGGTSRVKKELRVTTSKGKGSSRRVFSRDAATSPDLAKPRGNGLLLTTKFRHTQVTEVPLTQRGPGKQKVDSTELSLILFLAVPKAQR